MGRFDGRATRPSRGVRDILRWKIVDLLLGGGRARSDASDDPYANGRLVDAPLLEGAPWRENDGSALAEPEPSITWVGHATFVIRLGESVVVTIPSGDWRAPVGVPRRRVFR